MLPKKFGSSCLIMFCKILTAYKEDSMKNKMYWLCSIIYYLIFFGFVSANDITFITSKGERASIDYDLLLKVNFPLINDKEIACQTTLYKETFDRISILLIYKTSATTQEFIEYLKIMYSFPSSEVADILNTLASLELNNVLEQCLLYCPEVKKRAIFSLCSDSIFKRIKLFNSFLRLKIPGELTRTLYVSANKARLLPLVCKKNDSLIDPNHDEHYLDKKLDAIALNEECIPRFNTIIEYENFFNIFFDIIFNFEGKASSDYASFLKQLFDKPELQSNYNIAVFCNLLKFFELELIADCVLEYLALNEKDSNFVRRKIGEVKSTLSTELSTRFGALQALENVIPKPATTPSVFNLWGFLK